MLFVDYSHEQSDKFKSIYHEVASQYKGKGLVFLIGHIPDSQGALEVNHFLHPQNTFSFDFNLLMELCINLDVQFFGLKEEKTPVIIVQDTEGLKFINQNVQVDHIATWLKDFIVRFCCDDHLF